MDHPPLYIHAGAHRTGTSSFQMCLHENRVALAAHGLALSYPKRDGIPSGTASLRLPTPRDRTWDHYTERTRTRLATQSTGQPLLLSEENIPGRMMHFMKGQFYPAARKRCQSLRDAWPGPIRHVLFVIRPYDQLFVSGFRKRAEDNPVPSFDALRPNYMRMNRGWPAVVRILRDVLQPERLTIVPYAVRGTSVSLLTRLIPDLAQTELVEPAHSVNVSATDAALIALQDHYATGKTLDRPRWQSIIDQHVQDRESKGFAAFTDSEVAYWSDRYATDLETIAAMSGVEMDGPE